MLKDFFLLGIMYFTRRLDLSPKEWIYNGKISDVARRLWKIPETGDFPFH